MEIEEEDILGVYGSLPSLLKWAGKHFAALAVLVPVLLAIITLLFVSGGDPATLVILASAVSVKVIVFAAVVHVLPGLVVPLLAMVAIVCHLCAGAAREGRETWRFLEILFGAGVLLTAFFTSILFLTLVLVFLPLTFPLASRVSDGMTKQIRARNEARTDQERVADRRSQLDKVTQFLAVSIAMSLVTTTLALVASDPLPVEVVHIKGRNPRVADVVSRDSGSTTFLYTGTSYIERVPNGNITAESFCEQPIIFLNENIAYLIENSKGLHISKCPNI